MKISFSNHTGLQNLNISRLLIIAIIIDIMIPKAGIKVSGVPITLGSLLFIFLIAQMFFKMLRTGKIIIYNPGEIIISFIYWSFILLGGMILSSDYSTSRSSLLIDYISLAGFSFIYLLLQIKIIDRVQIEFIVKKIEICIIIVLLYAILQYIFGIRATAIPGITVNYSDYIANPNSWWWGKANRVGNITTKIVSTYQNGNVLGANILMIFPVILDRPRKQIWKKYLYLLLLMICVFFSGSRTAFFGLTFYLILLLAQYAKRKKFRKRTVFYFFLFIVAVMIIIFIIVLQRNDYYNRLIKAFNWNSILQATGRTDNLIDYLIWLFTKGNFFNLFFGSTGITHDGGAYEMVFGRVFVRGGLLGLLLFVLPWIKTLQRLYQYQNDWLATGLFNGLLVYMFVACVDGAFWLVPAATNYWLFLGMGQIICRLKMIPQSQVSG